MLSVRIPGGELYDEEKECFITVKPMTLRLEHSLVSLSKWEAKWRKPFLVKNPPKTREESLDYIRCMTLNQNVDPNVYYTLTPSIMKEINDYIEADLTATTFSSKGSPSRSSEVLTSELIYYYIVGNRIPFEVQKWHLSRLMTLLRICSIKNSPDKKMSKREVMSRNRALNEARRAKLHTKG